MAQKQIIVEMSFDRSTKNKHLYRAVDDENPIIENIYINKLAMEKPVMKVQVAVTDISKS